MKARKQIALPNWMIALAQPSASKVINERLGSGLPLPSGLPNRNFINRLANLVNENPEDAKLFIAEDKYSKLQQGSGIYQWIVNSEQLESWIAQYGIEDEGDLAFAALSTTLG